MRDGASLGDSRSPADRHELPWRDVKQDGPGAGHLLEGADPLPGDDLTAEVEQLRDERIGHPVRATTDHRPADRVRIGRQDQPERGGRRPIQGDHRMGGDPCEQAACLVGFELGAGQAPGRTQRRQPESRERERMTRHVDDWLQEFAPELVGIAHQRTEQRAPGAPVRAEGVGRIDHRSLEDGRATAIERMGDRRVRLDQLDAARGQIDRCEERRCQGQRQDRGADVVLEAWERQLGGARSAAGRRGRLVDTDRAPCTGQGDRGGQPVRSGPHHDRIEVSHPDRVWPAAVV